MTVWLGRAAIFAILTALTQVGGLAYLGALAFRRRLLAFLAIYALLWGVAHLFAPYLWGRVALPCTGGPLRAQSFVSCVALRNFATPELAEVAQDAAARMASEFPGTITLALDGSFPFFDGFPLLPHLSHDDGTKLDLAFYYADADGTYLEGKTRSPIGYWAIETDGGTLCPTDNIVTMRWGMGALQPLWPAMELEPERTAKLINILAADSRVAKIFVEPELATALGVQDSKIRFQGCRAARHDDHIHFQL